MASSTLPVHVPPQNPYQAAFWGTRALEATKTKFSDGRKHTCALSDQPIAFTSRAIQVITFNPECAWIDTWCDAYNYVLSLLKQNPPLRNPCCDGSLSEKDLGTIVKFFGIKRDDFLEIWNRSITSITKVVNWKDKGFANNASAQDRLACFAQLVSWSHRKNLAHYVGSDLPRVVKPESTGICYDSDSDV